MSYSTQHLPIFFWVLQLYFELDPRNLDFPGKKSKLFFGTLEGILEYFFSNVDCQKNSWWFCFFLPPNHSVWFFWNRIWKPWKFFLVNHLRKKLYFPIFHNIWFWFFLLLLSMNPCCSDESVNWFRFWDPNREISWMQS